MDFRIIPFDDAKAWDAALDEAGGGDVYYRRGYLDALRRRGEGLPVLIGGLAGKGSACHVTLIRDLRGVEFEGIDLISPYGYSGPLLSRKDPEAVSDFVRLWDGAAREIGAVSEFIRFHPVLKTHDGFTGLMDAPKISETVAMDLTGADLATGFSETCRKNLKVAGKKGVEVHFHDGRELPRFAKLYRDTMSRRGAGEYYVFENSYFDDLARGLGDDLWVVLATQNGMDAAGALVLRHGPYLHYHLGGSNYDLRSSCATNLVLAKVAERGRELGLKTFHLGGGLAPGDSLFRFKAGFSPVRLDFHIGRKVYDKPKYDILSSARRAKGSTDERFFPAYRAPVR